MLMDMPSKEFALAGSLEELKIKGRLVVHGQHRPILVLHADGHVFALDNRCPHMGFPLDRVRQFTNVSMTSSKRRDKYRVAGQTA